MWWRRPAAAAVLAMGAAALAACSTVAEPPPVLNLDARICVPSLDLASAQPLPLEGTRDQGAFTPPGVTVPLGADAACWKPINGEKRVYVLFKLPESPAPYIISVASSPVGTALFSPDVEMLDQDGNVVREVRRDSFAFHGTALYAGLRSHLGETYLLVASDPASVGQTVSQIAETTQATRMSTGGGGGFTLHTGSETMHTLVFAHSGRLTVTAAPFPKAN